MVNGQLVRLIFYFYPDSYLHRSILFKASHLGMAWLEIRRASSITISEVTKEERIFSIDWVPTDRPDIGTPFVTFVFNFELEAPQNRSTQPTPLSSPARLIRNGSLQTEDEPDTKYALRSQVHISSPSLSGSSSSDEENEMEIETKNPPRPPKSPHTTTTKAHITKPIDLNDTDTSGEDVNGQIATSSRKRVRRESSSKNTPQRRAKRPKISTVVEPAQIKPALLTASTSVQASVAPDTVKVDEGTSEKFSLKLAELDV